MPGPLIRILSDLHYGDRASRVRDLAQIRPLFAGATELVFNGDTLDTRPGPDPTHTAELRAHLDTFLRRADAPVTLITGNHDPDLSPHHSLDLAAGQVFVTHGDILFSDIVPWSQDAATIRQLFAAETIPTALADRLALWRRIAALIPQRHQSERNPLKYALRFATDTIWPPLRVFRILGAWRAHAPLASGFVQHHRPHARFILTGHIHRPGIKRTPSGLTVINTGSFCPPLGGCAVDLTPTHLTVRRIDYRDTAFHLGAELATFSLAPA